MHDLFENVNLVYGQELEKSIKELYRQGDLKEKGRSKYYNYLILDADKLYKLFEKFDTNELCIREVRNSDLDEFKGCVIYVGKGCGERKYIHLRQAENLMNGHSDKR